MYPTSLNTADPTSAADHLELGQGLLQRAD